MQTKVAIAGAGPVGLTLALFLRKLQVPFILFEKKKDVTQHPSAHYINMRTMEVFSEIYDIDKRIYHESEDFELFRNFRYCRSVLSGEKGLFGITDHLYPSPAAKKKILLEHSYCFPTHMPQPCLVKILDESLSSLIDGNKFNFVKDSEVQGFENHEDKVKVHLQDKKVVSADYLVACDGFHSVIRKKAGIKLSGHGTLQNFLNVYFHSKKLAESIQANGENAMLHFIYNPKTIAVLVNHSYRYGWFVLQVPIHLTFQKKEDFTPQKCKEIITACLNHPLKDNDISIKHIGFWNLSGVVADSFFKDNILLAGDSAHSLPPAGGFGMNTGIQDAHNLAYKLEALCKNESLDRAQKKDLLQRYSDERKSVGEQNLATAMKYYQNSVNTAAELGLKVEHLNFFKGILESVPFFGDRIKSSLFEGGLGVGQSRLNYLNPHKYRGSIGVREDLIIPLIFPKEEVGFSWNPAQGSKDTNPLIRRLLPHFFLKNDKLRLSSRQLFGHVIDNLRNNEKLISGFKILLGRIEHREALKEYSSKPETHVVFVTDNKEETARNPQELLFTVENIDSLGWKAVNRLESPIICNVNGFIDSIIELK